MESENEKQTGKTGRNENSMENAGAFYLKLGRIRGIIHLSRPPKRSLPLIQEVNDDGICNF